MPPKNRRVVRLALLLSLVLELGCGPDDGRLHQLSQQSLDRQAEQNRDMAKQNQTVVDATRELVTADAEARREMIEASRDVQAERASLDRQHESLEQERREVAKTRHRDPIIANAIQSAALLIAIVLPLALGAFLARGIFLAPPSEALNELLIAEFGSDTGILLPFCRELPPTLESVPETASAGTRALLPSPDLPLLESTAPIAAGPLRILVVVEGINDVLFLRKISAMLLASDPSMPELRVLADRNQLVFLPIGGGDLQAWTSPLQGYNHLQFHLYDRELPPLTEQREQLVEQINRRPNCTAVLTRKRAIENYLHPAAVRDALALDVTFGDQEDVPEVIAKHRLLQNGGDWEQLSRLSRKRLRDRAKRQLHGQVLGKMTPDRLAERSPQGEVRGWLMTIAGSASISAS